MKKVAILFVVAVLAPSGVLAWLAIRSLRDQQYVLEHQQSLLYQGVADAAAKEIHDYLADRQREFDLQVEALLADQNARQIAPYFDEHLLKTWPFAEVGFVVSLDGQVLAPALAGRAEARRFRSENDPFLSNREAVEVYSDNPKGMPNIAQLEEAREDFKKNYQSKFEVGQNAQVAQPQARQLPTLNPGPQAPSQAQVAPGNQVSPLPGNQVLNSGASNNDNQLQVSSPSQAALPAREAQGPAFASQFRNDRFTKGQFQQRKVVPQKDWQPEANSFSRVAFTETEFRQLIGDATEGTLARFLQNKLKLLIWYRSPRDPQLVFGAQLNLNRIVQDLRTLIQAGSAQDAVSERTAQASLAYVSLNSAGQAPLKDICLTLLDDNGKPVALSHPQFRADWKHPFVATEIGEILPHWEVGVYLLNPAKLSQSAQTLRFTVSLFVGLMLLAISIGGWLIVSDLRRELTLARQKTDFVSNVSHELKTPLTSIRMFSELLAEGRVSEPAKQRTYLTIITAEAARLTRLINNVLDFARIERGEKKYHFQKCDVVELLRETVDFYRPHLEANGFRLGCTLPNGPLFTNGDRDAVAQVVVNLLSNAEKYANDHRQIDVEVGARSAGLPLVEVRVLDRGLGIPPGCEEKIFEKFFRAHDALASGIQGSGLGLTLARQVARAHGGDVLYAPREGGGSCFTLRLPWVQVEGTGPGSQTLERQHDADFDC